MKVKEVACLTNCLTTNQILQTQVRESRDHNTIHH